MGGVVKPFGRPAFTFEEMQKLFPRPPVSRPPVTPKMPPQPINRYTRTRVRPINQPTGPTVRPTNPAITNPNVRIGPGLPAPIQQPARPPEYAGMPDDLYNQMMAYEANRQKLVDANIARGMNPFEAGMIPEAAVIRPWQEWLANNPPNTQQQPGGPFQSRPDLGPGVGFGPGLPQLEAMPYTDSTAPMQQSGMPGGKSNPIGNFIGSAASLIPNAIGNAAAQSQDPNAQRIAPLFTGLGGLTNQAFGGMTSPGGKSQPANYQPTQATQQNPNVSIGFGPASNFGSAVGTQSPMLNSIGAGFNPNAGNTMLPGNF